MSTALPYRILIAEDDPAQAAALATLLEPSFAVETAGTLAAAQSRLAADPPIDAVLLDLVLPNGRGLAMVRLLRLRHPRIPLIVYTATDLDTEALIESGAEEVLRKAIASPEDIRETVIQAIARQRVNLWLGPLAVEEKLAAAERSIESGRTSLARSH